LALGGLDIALVACAAIHACILFRPGGAHSPRVSAGQQRNQEAVQVARSRIERRDEARRMLQANPVLARELRIGRPDLPREYDDGGLVDINRVSRSWLPAVLGFTSEESASVLVARDKLGRFTDADELCSVTDLSPRRVDELRDLMIFT
jgi:DNA uptake protein ComE-like DNA-binding protein